jgi:uncharacterized protein YdaU (DUF1376 family)
MSLDTPSAIVNHGKTRLHWFAFWVDDFLGGTTNMLQVHLGAYLQAILAQWKSGDLQAIPADEETIRVICRGPMYARVRAKFTEIEVEGEKYLRNERLAAEWLNAKREYETRRNRGKAGAEGRRRAASSTTPSTTPSTTSSTPQPITHKKNGLAVARPGARVDERDPLVATFKRRYQMKYEIPYRWQRGKDDSRLEALRKDLNGALTSADWETAAANYLASPQASHTLAGLCGNFATFRRSALDRYGRPTVGSGNGTGKTSGAAPIVGKYGG